MNPAALGIDGLPFSLLFAEEQPAATLRPYPASQLGAKLAKWLGPSGPTGLRDKIVVVTSPADRTADYLVLELIKRGAAVCRLNPARLHECELTISLGQGEGMSGRLRSPECHLALDEVCSVLCRGPAPPIVDRRDPRRFAHVPTLGTPDTFTRVENEAVANGFYALLDQALWINHPDAMAAADNKVANLRLAQAFGLPIPRTLLTNDPEQVREFFEACGGQMIVKTLRMRAVAMGGTRHVLWTNPVSERDLEHAELVRAVPCLFQENVAKDVEVRVTIVGHRVFTAEIHSQSSAEARHDWRRQRDHNQMTYLPHELPAEAEAACLRLLRHHGLAFGAIDMIRRPDGTYVFLELNPVAEWLWIERLAGLPISEALMDLLMSGSIE